MIEFKTCARNSISKLIKLENPLSVPVTYEMTCPQEGLEYEKTVTLDPHTVVPKRESYKVDFNYFVLVLYGRYL